MEIAIAIAIGQIASGSAGGVPTVAAALLMESTGYILLESGDKLLLE